MTSEAFVTGTRYDPVELFIDGQLSGCDNKRLEIINPATEDVLGTAAIAT